jgi:putative transposase
VPAMVAANEHSGYCASMSPAPPPREPALRFFDREAEFGIVERRLPHWAQSRTLCFITLRTDDSMPADIVKSWRAERRQWLRRHGINPRAADWKQRLRQLDRALQIEFHRTFSERWHDELDRCHGECVLRRPELAVIVEESLHHFDGDRYDLTDLVVMPNHVHLIAAFRNADAMLAQCESWKHFTARQINRLLQRSNRFWEEDGFDHLVRNEEQFIHLRRYIAANPAKARLRAGEFRHWSKSLEGLGAVSLAEGTVPK